MENYDVIVIGAGPAGLMAARKASETGASVLILEKDKTLGTKVCGEAASSSTLKDAEIEPSPRFIANTIQSISVHAPDENKTVEIHSEELGFSEGYIFEKTIFLRELASLAVKKGAEIWVRSEARDVATTDGGYTVTVNRFGQNITVKAKVLIGCDGINSMVAKKFFKREGYDVIPCIQYKLVNCNLGDIHTLGFYLGREVAPLGYAWVFPKSGDEANVGIGVRGVPAKPYLDRFIANHSEKFEKTKIIEVDAAPVPIGGQIRKMVNGNILLCGDAAGQVIPMTGGGIHTSIVAGRIAGGVAGKAALSGKLDPKEYPTKYRYLSKRIDDSLTTLRLIEKLTDPEFNQLAEILTGQDIIDLANGMNMERVGKKLLDHPHFAERLAEALLGSEGD